MEIIFNNKYHKQRTKVFDKTVNTVTQFKL